MDARKDEGGGTRGAKGIDGKKDQGFQLKGIDKSAERKMYGGAGDIESSKTGGEAG